MIAGVATIHAPQQMIVMSTFLRSSARRHVFHSVYGVCPVYLRDSRPLWRSPTDQEREVGLSFHRRCCVIRRRLRYWGLDVCGGTQWFLRTVRDLLNGISPRFYGWGRCRRSEVNNAIAANIAMMCNLMEGIHGAGKRYVQACLGGPFHRAFFLV